MLGILLLSIAPYVYAIPQLPILTFTHGVTTQTTELCTTLYASTSVRGPVPTHNSTVTLRPHVVVVLTDTTPLATITPMTSIFWETLNPVSETTVTNPTVTDTFSSTSWELSTTTTTQTISDTTTATFSTTTTSTSIIIRPTPARFTPISDTVGHTNFSGALSNKGNPDYQQPLELRDLEGHENRVQKEAAASFNIDFLASKSPVSVECNKYLSPTWTEKIAWVHPSRTTVAPTPVSTKTTTITLTSTLTENPRAGTTVTTTSTTWTTEEAITSTLEVISTTTTLEAAVQTTYFEACAPNNLLGPQLDNGMYLAPGRQLYPHISSPGYPLDSAYSCCAACQETPYCQFNIFIAAGNYCIRFIDIGPAPMCLGGDVAAELSIVPESHGDAIASNGPCGLLVPST